MTGEERSDSANGLKLVRRLPSRTEPVDPCTDESIFELLAAQFTDRTAAVVWLDDRVEICLYHGGNFSFYKDETFNLHHVQRMRVFNRDRELHVWRIGDGWQGRLRRDGKGEKGDMVIARQLLFGTRRSIDSLDRPGFSSITEDRGTTLHLPLIGIRFDEKGGMLDRIFIKTNNYIGTNRMHQAGYIDCRFAEFLASIGESNSFKPLELAD